MNIFVLDDDIKTCAEYHCDKHVVKMFTEYVQLMSTAHRLIDGIPTKVNDKKVVNLLPGEEIVLLNSREYTIKNKKAFELTHENHPCAIWVRESSGNYEYLSKLAVAVYDEYEFRYGKHHKTMDTFCNLVEPPKGIKNGGMTEFAQCMPDKYQIPGDAITAYRNFYRGEKGFAKWKDRGEPMWYLGF